LKTDAKVPPDLLLADGNLRRSAQKPTKRTKPSCALLPFVNSPDAELTREIGFSTPQEQSILPLIQQQP
jgi:hypothetical protein